MPDNDLTDAAEAFALTKSEHLSNLLAVAFMAGAIWQQERVLASKQAELDDLRKPVLEANDNAH